MLYPPSSPPLGHEPGGSDESGESGNDQSACQCGACQRVCLLDADGGVAVVVVVDVCCRPCERPYLWLPVALKGTM